MRPSKDELGPLLARLGRWLGRRRRRFLKGLRPGATPAELDALQARLGMPLPQELRVLLAWHNGQTEDFVGRFEQDWILMGTDDIARAKPDLDADAKATGWRPAWIPFLDDDNGDYVCLDTSVPGPPVREFWAGNAAHEVVAPSLTAWVKAFVANVEKGRYAEDPERGTFMLRR